MVKQIEKQVKNAKSMTTGSQHRGGGTSQRKAQDLWWHKERWSKR